MKIFVSQLNLIIGDLEGNSEKILKKIEEAKNKNADCIVFSELAICGYPPDDFLLFKNFINEMQREVEKIINASSKITIIIGAVRKGHVPGKGLYNSALIIKDRHLLGYKDKTLLPTYDVFDEARYFDEGEEQKVFEICGKKVGILICEDVWNHSLDLPLYYLRDPVLEIKKLKPDLLILVTASPYYFKKMELRKKNFDALIDELKCPLIVCNQVGGYDQLLFDGYSCCINIKKEYVYLAKGFLEDSFIVDSETLTKGKKIEIDHLKDLFDALVVGLKDYVNKQKFKKVLLGLSGGIDSSLTAAIAVEALGCENVLALNMPSRFSSLSSIEDANELANNLKISIQHIPIDHIYQQFLDLLSPQFMGKKVDATEENLQARIRGMILMAISNKFGHLVLSTGNKSEMAVGYTTLYGDMAGGLALLGDISKTQVYELAKYVNRKNKVIPDACFTKAPSAELRLNQKDQDELPPYEILDKIIVDYVEEHLSVEEIQKKYQYNKVLVEDIIRRIHIAEFKRRQGAISLRVSKRSFSRGRVFPIVQGWIKTFER